MSDVGIGPILSVSSGARRRRSGTGFDRGVARLPTTMAVVEQTMPISMGASPVTADSSASSQPTELTVPTSIDAMAPTALAFFHHTAQM